MQSLSVELVLVILSVFWYQPMMSECKKFSSVREQPQLCGNLIPI